MGTTCCVTVVGGDARLLEAARRRVDDLEAKWSRFREDSEISRLNRRSGQPTGLSPDSFLLVDHAVAGWRATGGRYDPTVLRAVEAAGYDRSFEQVPAEQTARPPAPPAPGCAGFVLDPRLRAVTMPPGVGFDPGGIGKGLAADLVVDALLDEGAAGACVDLGGDGRMAGEPPPGGWRVGIGDPYAPDHLLAVVALGDHGIATSSRLIRRWTAGGATRHHLIDPRTGASIGSGLDAVTVVAVDAWVAEVLTKAAFVAGPAGVPHLVRQLGVALLVQGPGSVTCTAGFEALVAGPVAGAHAAGARVPVLV
jgi:thiamine biosynthesis lipoprotein